MASNRVHRVRRDSRETAIRREAAPEGPRVLEAASRRYGFNLHARRIRLRILRLLRAIWPHDAGGSGRSGSAADDAIFFGAVGWPDKAPDHMSPVGLAASLFRREFDQYVEPAARCKLMPGVPSPLADRKPGDIDFYVVRENTEGEYSSIGGRMFARAPRAEFVVQEATVMTRDGVDRILRFAFELAGQAPRRSTSPRQPKSNGISITMPYWDERVEAMAAQYPAVRVDKYHIDILTAHFVQHPDWFDVVVASNLFGDILSGSRPGAAPGRSPSRRRATSIRSGPRHRCSNPCMARRPTLPARVSPIRSARSGLPP